MELDSEQRAWIATILKSAGVTTKAATETLAAGVASSISAFELQTAALKGELTFRATHDRLRRLWFLVSRRDPPVGLIRRQLNRLPAAVLAKLETRAQRLWPLIFGVVAPAASGSGWLSRAPADLLIESLPKIIADGRERIPGRRRGQDTWSKPTAEPRILGVVRRQKSTRSSGDPAGWPPDSAEPRVVMGGRPRDDEGVQLIAMLAIDWLQATGEPPPKSRSYRTPFGDLVHQVFDWKGREDASGALRRYWREQVVRLERQRWVAEERPASDKVAPGFGQREM